MSSGPSVAVIGGTGFVGLNISDAFLTDFRTSFSRVRILTRDAGTPKAQGLAYKGAELFQVDEDDVHSSLDAAFADIDVIVNTLPTTVSDRLNHGVLRAVARSGAKVYFLSEFMAYAHPLGALVLAAAVMLRHGLTASGVLTTSTLSARSDHRHLSSPGFGFEPAEWQRRRALAREVRRSFRGKVIALYTSLFFELAMAHPVLGFDIANNEFTAYGSPAQRVSFTSLRDIGRAVARRRAPRHPLHRPSRTRTRTRTCRRERECGGGGGAGRRAHRGRDGDVRGRARRRRARAGRRARAHPDSGLEGEEGDARDSGRPAA
ncbi:hypothetical protein GSI_09940 [Ganoderma sinense ZZ0214-1]|uniref:NmrA-like domain-containing protein n=1 Tax=Ganoderma sinense ZZ0214-1 TaxID=1077348 RepID=A0A2G8S2B3_9APHY|nr:hypothetical protein GSI_09940 [Ganoderma sinense ZZ0214-1]